MTKCKVLTNFVLLVVINPPVTSLVAQQLLEIVGHSCQNTLLLIHVICAINSGFYTFISAYAVHGFPPNSNYSSQGSWYNYPANGYAGGYSAYPGATGYWSKANGPPSHSNLSTNPPSSQAMVQYPVCPRKPHPYLVQVIIKVQSCHYLKFPFISQLI